MPRTILLLTLLVSLSVTASAAPKWLRRATLIAASTLMAVDGYQTANMPAGVTEGNPLYRDAAGRPRMGRVIGLKLGVALSLAVAEEQFGKRPFTSTLFTIANAGLAANGAWTVWHNHSVARQR